VNRLTFGLLWRLRQRRTAPAHPAWCAGDQFHTAEDDRANGYRVRGASIRESWLPEIRDSFERQHLPARGGWIVHVTCTPPRLMAVVEVELYDVTDESTSWRRDLQLQPAEARELGQALIDGADRLDRDQ
jgi:hypothetical protein